jgi:tRNA A-37 threonylcarbamoyl transferase component Bud32
MDELRVIRQPGGKWTVRLPAAQPLLADGWPPDDAARLVPVKTGDRRRVFRFEAGGGGYFLKVYDRGGPLRTLRALLGLGPGRREWNALLAARDAGLDVPEPVALAMGAREAIITREVPGGERLDEALFARAFEPLPGDPPYPGARPPELVSVFRRRAAAPAGLPSPRELAERLADLVNRLRRADVYLPDLHPGNVLISPGPDAGGGWRLTLVDLAEAVTPAPPETTLKHLMQLEHFFAPLASVAERLRCLAHLRKAWSQAPLAPVVARATAAYRHAFYARRDRRTRRTGKYFRRMTAAGGWRGWAASDWAETVERLLASAADAAPPFPGATVLKAGRTSTVWRVAAPDGRTLVVKRHNRAARRQATHGLLAPSRSVAAFRKGHALLVRGIATARPAAAVDRTHHGRVTDTLVLTEHLDGAVRLPEYLASGPSARARHRLTWRLARMAARLHDLGMAHRDLKAPNVLVVPGDGDDPRPFLVDLDGLGRPRRSVSAHRRARDLMRLAVSLEEFGVSRRSDALRFLRTYLTPAGCPRPVATRGRRRGNTAAAARLRRWWKRIAHLAARKWERLRRKADGAAPGHAP